MSEENVSVRTKTQSEDFTTRKFSFMYVYLNVQNYCNSKHFTTYKKYMFYS